jgi:hypothetical protein
MSCCFAGSDTGNGSLLAKRSKATHAMFIPTAVCFPMLFVTCAIYLQSNGGIMTGDKLEILCNKSAVA